ncbi:MAG: DUF1800 domain-containing protein [Gemmatimonadetes bacterium]|nr:DUF1800 domain-containing protein [Gemmatimonadota bacterium]MYD59790.1 DUF1800 domain-containing protein [Gemmatimonadota bacterium]
MILRVALAVLCCGALLAVVPANADLQLPYKAEGLSKEQAATYLLERFAFGARPGEVEKVAKMGPEKWLAQQLKGNLPDAELDKRLEAFPALKLTPAEMQAIYVRNGLVQSMMEKEGLIDPAAKTSRKEMNEKTSAYRKKHGLRSYGMLASRELRGQKVMRAVYSENQLVEVLTDFWFNHFNVTTSDGAVRNRALSYERDAIRPNVLGKFRVILGATAKHPAMLYYLDNAQSRMAPPSKREQAEPEKEVASGEMGMDGDMDGGMMSGEMMGGEMAKAVAEPNTPPKRKYGLNENYARELMELHTLGVDGGYTQQDVTEVARVLTGWAAMPYNNSKNVRKNLEKQIATGKKKVIRQGEFLFRKDWHDQNAKVVLGEQFPAGGGIEEGERVLDMLSKHPSTARFISTKLARRFVNDEPSDDLIDELAETFTKTDGDIAAVMATLAQSRVFWAEAKKRSKMKSPFELVVSSLRALEADVKNAQPLMRWFDRMGEPLYGYLQPTGFPDYAESWANSGTLIARINFGIHLATGRINGVTLKQLPKDSAGLTTDEALAMYSKLLLPAQDTSAIASEVKKTVPADAERKDVQVISMLIGSPEFQYR